ncbi:MAG: cytochrome c biogenesis protein CcsA [Deltaproteobacteria bacterium]|nr:cytochrome c biogenesis protein CcsA [Deltaproteobacteria bacterium]
MTWDNFICLALPAALCWIFAGLAALRDKKPWIVNGLMITGIILFAVFIAGLWIGLERPPLRTMGETRLWYSFFLALIGYLTYRHWKYPWLLLFSAVVASVFIGVNLFKPEIHSKALMPALQSYYFVPHVTVYILSYAMLGVATIASGLQLRNMARGHTDRHLYAFMDNIVYIGFGFLALGMLSGALWAKEAWGHYWSWDPKETWAFITGAAYLVYIHMRLRRAHPKFTLWALPVAFVLLMITWLGVTYLPSAQGSIHVYS